MCKDREVIFDQFFIVIPVYRLQEEQYYKDMESHFEKQISKSWPKDFREKNIEMETQYKSNHRQAYGGDWDFNEIVGHIKLFFMGSQVRGEYWSTRPHRKVRTRKKQFEFKAQKLVAESKVWEKDSKGILLAVEEYLERCQKELKNRHIDLREFNSLKNHIDWHALHKTKNVFA